MATVAVANLTKHYGKTVGVDDLSLQIGDGEFFVILGPSGAGKTTTLKSIAGLLDIDGGTVHIGGTDMTRVEPYHRNVAMAFESYALYPQKTLRQNLASPLKSGRTGNYTAAQQQERIDQVTTTLGINHLQDRFPRELSNGQRQRVALGRVLVRPADVYLLDEPLSHLDAKLRAEMRAELKTLGAMSNTTTIYVTHDYQEALALGTRIAVIRNGKLVQVDTPAEIWHHPADTFVARALGQPEINLVDAVVDGGNVIIPGTKFAIPVPGDLGLGAGDKVRIGIRPSDLDLVAQAEESAGHVTVPGRVILAERLGRNIEVSVDLGGTTLIGLSPGGPLAEEGVDVAIRVDLEHVHLFAAGDGDTARLGSAAQRRKEF
ncbi:ABC transporter ATP-binding protein [Microlunatus parietis]|uniref:ABC-type sugar transport system ATPase subunit n=1 Tax=Microlunatus parietis TaxID=682979 RepID=A0A7Y9LD43_9ACTN|nr:ABC transporter ATP-binding protein [Microlunatus parietis]NYE72375.1 ABC-type sugar transport system ATPase subunit [Microlunatus parietis]